MSNKLFIIDMSDQRCKYLYEMIKNKGYDVVALEKKGLPNVPLCIMIFSPSKLINLSDVAFLTKGSIIFGGNADIESKEYIKNTQLDYVNVLEDEIFLTKNTLPTAEGCLKLIIENTDQTFQDLRTLILGYGRVSKTLSNYLISLGVNTHIYSIDKEEKALALINANVIIDDLEELQDFDVIINTIPATIFNDIHMNQIKKGSFVCDLASGNYINIEHLIEKNINAKKATALPGKISPRSAATYLYTSIFDTLNSKEMNL